jgi:cell division transport system ATP-binding protein
MYGNHVGLKDVTLSIDKGEFVFIVGPSGSGKSTFIKLISRELKADEGHIYVGDKDVVRMSNREIPDLRRSIGMVFQNFRLLPNKTVYENVAFAMEVVRSPRRTIKRQVPQILSVMGISDKAKNFPHELSMGEQQRVAIARALINDPPVILADEPTGNLDSRASVEIVDFLKQLNASGKTIIMVTHEPDIAAFAKRRIVVKDGRIDNSDTSFTAEAAETAGTPA